MSASDRNERSELKAFRELETLYGTPGLPQTVAFLQQLLLVSLNLIEMARIVDGNSNLICNPAEKRHLRLCKVPRLRTAEGECAEPAYGCRQRLVAD